LQRVNNAAGATRTVTISDPGVMLTGRSVEHVAAFLPANRHPADLAGAFKTPTLWGVRLTAPYFHDNSAKTLRDVVDHYADFFFPPLGVFLTPQDRADIVAFLERF
jgi:cytochrome c peroxidase